MAIVYEHLRNDTNEVFYVGIGAEEKRAFDKKKRSPYWKHIVNKMGYSVNIIHKDIDWEDAKKIEILLIEKYGRKNLGTGNLVNMTDGGDGTLGLVVSDKTRQKISEGNKGKTLSEDTKQKISETKKGKIMSEETKQKMSETKKGEKHPMFGKKRSEEVRQKISETLKGKTHSEETKQKKSASMKGKIKTQEHIAKYIASRKTNKLKKTPRCIL
jgi:hypothetical protein